MPSASRTSTIASVPLATPIVSATPSASAASRSKPSTSGPKMKRPLSSVRSNAAFSSGISGAYCALTSTWGIGRCLFTAGCDGSGAAAPDQDECGQRHGRDDNQDLEVAAVVLRRVPAGADGPADTGEDGTEERDARDGRDEEAPEADLEDPGRN